MPAAMKPPGSLCCHDRSVHKRPLGENQLVIGGKQRFLQHGLNFLALRRAHRIQRREQPSMHDAAGSPKALFPQPPKGQRASWC